MIDYSFIPGDTPEERLGWPVSYGERPTDNFYVKSLTEEKLVNKNSLEKKVE